MVNEQTRKFYPVVDLVGRDIRGSEVISYMIPVEIKEGMFSAVCETLTRIGIASKKPGHKELFQSVHILHKKGTYFLTHYKTLFALDNKPHTLTVGDVSRLNLIADLLTEWGLVKPILWELQLAEPNPMCTLANLVIVKHSEKSQWTLSQKYAIGVKK